MNSKGDFPAVNTRNQCANTVVELETSECVKVNETTTFTTPAKPPRTPKTPKTKKEKKKSGPKKKQVIKDERTQEITSFLSNSNLDKVYQGEVRGDNSQCTGIGAQLHEACPRMRSKSSEVYSSNIAFDNSSKPTIGATSASTNITLIEQDQRRRLGDSSHAVISSALCQQQIPGNQQPSKRNNNSGKPTVTSLPPSNDGSVKVTSAQLPIKDSSSTHQLCGPVWTGQLQLSSDMSTVRLDGNNASASLTATDAESGPILRQVNKGKVIKMLPFLLRHSCHQLQPPVHQPRVSCTPPSLQLQLTRLLWVHVSNTRPQACKQPMGIPMLQY